MQHGVRANDGVVEERGGSRGKRTVLCLAIENGDVETALLLVSKGGASMESDASEPPLNEGRFSQFDQDAIQAYTEVVAAVEMEHE